VALRLGDIPSARWHTMVLGTQPLFIGVQPGYAQENYIFLQSSVNSSQDFLPRYSSCYDTLASNNNQASLTGIPWPKSGYVVKEICKGIRMLVCVYPQRSIANAEIDPKEGSL
jgi:hypothetical protein